jgi:hypothetical protein
MIFYFNLLVHPHLLGGLGGLRGAGAAAGDLEFLLLVGRVLLTSGLLLR